MVLTKDELTNCLTLCSVGDQSLEVNLNTFLNESSRPDYPDAYYVHQNQMDDGCTYYDFKKLIDGKCYVSKQDSTDGTGTFIGYRSTQGMISPEAAHLQDALNH